MNPDIQIPEPVLFNPLKHHLGFMREFVFWAENSGPDYNPLIKILKHIGTSVMDVYTGRLLVEEICEEVRIFLERNDLICMDQFAGWAGKETNDFRIIPLSDDSHWTLKFHNNGLRFVHIFPARLSRNTFRIKSNTLKSALIYYALVGKDYITGADLNRVRNYLGLSPVKEAEDSAITEMIEILRDGGNN
jgi:hypothetical protein